MATIAPAPISTTQDSAKRYSTADFCPKVPGSAKQIQERIDAASRSKRRDRDELPTSTFARDTAKDAIKHLEQISDCIPMPAVVPFSGGLQIIWKSAQGRSVQLFCSPELGKDYIYSRDSISRKGMMEGANVATLASRLSWLLHRT